MRANLVLIFALAILTQACGTGFVKGWRKDVPERDAETQCHDRDGWSWVNNECQKNGAFSLTDVTSEADCKRLPDSGWFEGSCLAYTQLNEDQCASIGGSWEWRDNRCQSKDRRLCEADGKVWKDDQCLVRPTLATDGGERHQEIVLGIAMDPIVLKPSVGALAVVTRETCPGFTKIDGNKLVRDDKVEAPLDATTCVVELIATLGELTSEPVLVELDLRNGFATACDAGEHTASQIVRQLQRASCKDALTALKDLEKLALANSQITDLSALRGLRKLKWLDLQGNPGLADLAPIAALPMIGGLDLTGTGVENVTAIKNIATVTFLYLDGTPLAKAGAKNENNCPTDGTNLAVKRFCSAR